MQSPWEVVNDHGDKEVIKQECYIFDFALERALHQISDYSCRLKVDDTSPEQKVSEFISFLPVLAFDGSSMNRIDAQDILDITYAGTSATLLAKRWQTALLVHVDNDTLKKLQSNQDALDALIVQLSTNDFSQGVPVGSVSSATSSEDISPLTLTGAIEYIIALTREISPDTKVMFYTCPLGENQGVRSEYAEYISGTLQEIAEKWDIGIIDIFNADYIDVSCYMQGDALHPQSEGYAGALTPIMINYLLENL